MNTLIAIGLSIIVPASAILLLLDISVDKIAYFIISTSLVMLIVSCFARLYSKILISIILVIVGFLLINGYLVSFLFYPVVASVFVSSIFITSYWRKHSLIESIALKMEENLPLEALPYCRKVNHSWSVFLLLNTLVTLYLASPARMQLWSLYTGLISYILIALLFGVELIIRSKVKKRINLQKLSKQSKERVNA